MSDIIKKGKPERASERALEWVERYVHQQGLRVGDSLPSELEIAAAAGVGRSSVREALTALKVLGITESRRKGGIRLVRDPALLELRHYFSDRLEKPGVYHDAMEFRSILEWGLGPLMLAKCGKSTVGKLTSILTSVAAEATDWADIYAAEICFHTILTTCCKNRLATLFAGLYLPIFALENDRPFAEADLQKWITQHQRIVDAMKVTDSEAFYAALRQHTHGYMRLKHPAGNPHDCSRDRRMRMYSPSAS